MTTFKITDRKQQNNTGMMPLTRLLFHSREFLPDHFDKQHVIIRSGSCLNMLEHILWHLLTAQVMFAYSVRASG